MKSCCHPPPQTSTWIVSNDCCLSTSAHHHRNIIKSFVLALFRSRLRAWSTLSASIGNSSQRMRRVYQKEALEHIFNKCLMACTQRTLDTILLYCFWIVPYLVVNVMSPARIGIHRNTLMANSRTRTCKNLSKRYRWRCRITHLDQVLRFIARIRALYELCSSVRCNLYNML